MFNMVKLCGPMKSKDLENAIRDEGLTKNGWQHDAKRVGLKCRVGDIGKSWWYYLPEGVTEPQNT